MTDFSHGHLPEAGREVQTEFNTMDEGGPLAKNLLEANLRAMNQI